MSEGNTIDGLPSFFQFQGKTVADGLMEFELGGDLEDDDITLEEGELEEPTDHTPMDITEVDINGIGSTSIKELDVDIQKYLMMKQSNMSEMTTNFSTSNPVTSSTTTSTVIDTQESKENSATISTSSEKKVQATNLLNFLKGNKSSEEESKTSSSQPPQQLLQPSSQPPQQPSIQNMTGSPPTGMQFVPPMMMSGYPPFPHPGGYLGPMPFPMQFPMPYPMPMPYLMPMPIPDMNYLPGSEMFGPMGGPFPMGRPFPMPLPGQTPIFIPSGSSETEQTENNPSKEATMKVEDTKESVPKENSAKENIPKGAWAKPPPFLPPPRPAGVPLVFPPSQVSSQLPPQAPPMEPNIYLSNPNEFLRKLPTGSMMTSSDVSYVIRRVLDPMQSADPFADDYYSIQFKIKKNNAIRDEFFANQTNGQPPPLLFIPLPTWKDTKDRIRKQIESAKKLSQDKARKWEEREKVLGHNVKADFTRPKEILSVPTLSEMFNPEDENADEILRVPYSTRLWNMRQAVQRGYEALYTVQELQYLLDTPMIADSSFNREEVVSDIKKAITGLAQSLGIRAPLEEDNSNSSQSNTNEISLEGGLVAAILQTAKGKRLLSRSFELLPPDYRWALLPAILARVLQVNPNDQAEEDKVVEEKLMKNLLDFIRFAHQYQKELQSKADDKFLEGGQSSAQFSYFLLGHLRQSLKSVMVTFLDKAQLRQALLSSRSRAEVMHIIVQVGDRVSEDVDAIATSEWVQIRETFMLMLDT